ncbi:MAG: DNA-protecting protein DprA, partial [Parcubacteria group bacterium]|nr:DNA-protecting protein DprA [Parcubacteria group bacterium]
GKAVVEQILAPLCRAGITIISGLALGIDGEAHTIALKENAKTIAVLGGGIDDATLYPRAHFRLAQEIIKRGGAIISEYPEKFLPTKYTFPARNRIIAGLAPATLVIEAPKSSGALITAKFALDFSREVMAVPADIIRENAYGGNALIQYGAHPIICAEDIALIMDWDIGETRQHESLFENVSDDEKRILELLQNKELQSDEVTRASSFSAQQVNVLLTMLEIKGKIKRVGGKYRIGN